jgi:hypothetical protein
MIKNEKSGIKVQGHIKIWYPETGEIALDSLNRAKYAIIGADYMPNVIILNPADWGAIERVKSTASSNDYAAGDGAVPGGGDVGAGGVRGV